MLRAVMIGLLLLAFGGIGVVGFVALRPAPPAPVASIEAPAPVPRRAVLVAARPLRAGALLKAEEIAPGTVDLAEGEAPVGETMLDTPAQRLEITGGLIRRTLAAGEPILATDVLRPGDHGFLAAVLSPGMRAIAIGVDAVSGTAGLIWPGDRVDVILTLTNDDNNAPVTRRMAGETVLSAVRIIAVDQHMVQGAMDTANTAGGGVVASARTVTVEVTARDAERLSVASRIGRLSLTVRSALLASREAEPPTQEEPAVTWGGDVSGALRASDTRGGGNGMAPLRVFNGPGRSEEVRF